MPIKFISLNEKFINSMKEKGYESECLKIQDYKPLRKTYYVSPANSLCFMDGGIDYALSRIIFPDIEKTVKKTVRELNIQNLLGRNYLPIGSSIIVDYNELSSLVVAPTMLLPQNVSKTQNAYYATMAVLYNVLVNKKENINNVDILLTSLCCGYGAMDEEESIAQILKGIEDYKKYSPKTVNQNIIIHEPNLKEQPKYYQNSEWFTIDPSQIERIT